MKLSVIIPTKNEEKLLPNCLKSVVFADEIIVVDSGSTDATVDIAHKAGALVHHIKWRGFSKAHNLGAAQATGDWLLYVDADERVSRPLREEITKTLTNPYAQAYQIKRKNFILGKPLAHGGWYPDYVTRLISKQHLDRWVGDLHEYPIVKGSTASLQGEIYHLTHRSISWMLHKSITYTKISAKLHFKNHHPRVGIKNLFGAMVREFFFRAIRKSGWKDGLIGWIEIVYQTFNAFLIQVWLWQMQRSQDMATTYKKIDKQISREL